ncbi:MAG: ribosomal protein S18-alanine N-acetyltransferase [Burkholderiaceae bacterium]
MNAILKPITQPEVAFHSLTADWLDRVLDIENAVYAHPWSRANFEDSIQTGYQMQVLTTADLDILGYFIAMKGFEEVHLLNITVAETYQHQGWAKLMLDALAVWSRGQGAAWLWLEVRGSNERAQQVYKAQGFKLVSVRQDYYPKGPKSNGREDAIVMSLKL